MLEPGLAVEIAQGLPPAAHQALETLLEHGGRHPIADLSLRFGPMRIAGPGRRDREQPWRDPQAALDGLWYRGFIGIAFFDTLSGPAEFAFLPDELRDGLRSLAPPDAPRLEAAPSPAILLPGGGAADDAVTVLAALRRRPGRSGRAASEALLPQARVDALRRELIHPAALPLQLALQQALGLLIPDPLRPDPARVRDFLVASRAEIEARLRDAWRDTRAYNDLAHTPGLIAPKSQWPNDPGSSREAVLGLIAACHQEDWYSIDALVADVRQRQPAFLRAAGDLEAWLLQDAADGRWLHGLADWDRVEGQLLRHVIRGPLFWLGAVDLGTDAPSRQPSHFRLRLPVAARPSPAVPTFPDLAEATARVLADGRLIVSRGVPLAHRYQVARFAEWMGRNDVGYAYRITPKALAAATSQGLDARRVAGILELVGRRPPPEPLRQAIQRWSEEGEEAVLETTLVLRVTRPETLRRLRTDGETARYLEEILGPTTARVRARQREALLAAAARRGLLIQPDE
jgi:hypothetical protein